MLVKRQKRQDILRAIERYDRATREHAFRGSRDPESMEEIDAEYLDARRALLALAKVLTPQ